MWEMPSVVSWFRQSTDKCYQSLGIPRCCSMDEFWVCRDPNLSFQGSTMWGPELAGQLARCLSHEQSFPRISWFVNPNLSFSRYVSIENGEWIALGCFSLICQHDFHSYPCTQHPTLARTLLVDRLGSSYGENIWSHVCLSGSFGEQEADLSFELLHSCLWHKQVSNKHCEHKIEKKRRRKERNVPSVVLAHWISYPSYLFGWLKMGLR